MTACTRISVFALTLATLGAGCNRSNETSRVIALVTHSSPGGGSDVFLREMAPHLSRIMGDTFIVENLQGGSGAKAMATLARAKPDGRIFYATTPTFIYTSLLSQPAASIDDLEPLVNSSSTPRCCIPRPTRSSRHCVTSSRTRAPAAAGGARRIRRRSNGR